MGEAEALLNSLTENIAHHEHPVTDTGSHFIIDPETREITNETRKHYIMQGDHNSQIYTFELPRYIDGHDMFMCNKVKVHFNNIAEDEQTENADVADATPLELTEDETAVICTWSIERNATQLIGILSFGLEYQCVTGDGEVVYEFNTDIYSNVHVKASRDNSEKAISEYSNILEQWRARIFGSGDSVMANIDSIADEQITAIHQQGATQKDILESTGNTQRDAIVAKGAEVLDTIPEDYTATHCMAEESVRSKANAIVCEASGKSIVVTDSSDDHLRGLKLFGKTTQATTTGAQLANLPDGEIELGGILWTCHGGVVTAKGTCNAESSSTGVSIHHNLTGMTGTYYVSGNSEPVKVYVRIKENGTERWFNNGPVTLDGTEDDVLFYMQVAGVGTTVDATLYPMLNAGDKPLPWEPYTGGKPSPNPEYPQELKGVTPEVTILNKNLANVSCYSSSKNYETLVDVTDLRGIRKGETYTISVWLDSEVESRAYWNNASRLFGYIEFEVNAGRHRYTYTFTAAADGVLYSTPVNLMNKYPMNDDKRIIAGNAQIEEGSNATDYAPFVVQQLTIPNTLPGIPVSSGGNYTDSEGQQWICDEIDFERGVYVQRITHMTFDGSEDESWVLGSNSDGINNRFQKMTTYVDLVHEDVPTNNTSICVANALCDSFVYNKTNKIPPVNEFRISMSKNAEYGHWYMLFNPDTSVIPLEDLVAWQDYLAENPITVTIPLVTPIETPIDGTTMAAFKTLCTNYPNTTILNDAGAWMRVKYNADTKTYVENPKVLKLVDSSTGVVYELKIVDGAIVANPV